MLPFTRFTNDLSVSWWQLEVEFGDAGNRVELACRNVVGMNASVVAGEGDTGRFTIGHI